MTLRGSLGLREPKPSVQVFYNSKVCQAEDLHPYTVHNLKEAERGSIHLWCGSEKTHHDR